MRFEVEFDGFVVVRDEDSVERVPTEDELHSFLERVMDELVEHGAEDPSISGAAGRGSVQISIDVEASQPDDAAAKGSATIRAAVHAVGAFTPGWSVDWCEVRARSRESASQAREFAEA